MSKKKKSFFVRLMCWILAGLMLLSVGTTLIYVMLGLL